MGSNRFVPVSATVSDGTRIYDARWQQHRSRGLSRAFSLLLLFVLLFWRVRWAEGASGGSVPPVSHGLRSAFIISLDHNARRRNARLLSTRIGGNARCTCSRLQPRLAPRNNTPAERLEHGGGSRARRIR